MLAQVDADITEAKQAFVNFDAHDVHRLAQAVERIAELVARRWWLRRVANPKAEVPQAEVAERTQRRTEVYAQVTTLAKAQSGEIQTETLQVVFFALSAKIDALWNFMIDNGLLTQAEMHNRLDAATQDLYSRATQYAAKIIVPSQASRRAS